MKLATLTLNPALDRTMYFNNEFISGKLNRAERTVLTVGSKGVNVSRIFKTLGIEAVAYGFSGGHNGKIMCDMLNQEHIPCNFVETIAETRINIKMIDSLQNCTEANEKGGPVTADEYNTLLDIIQNKTDDLDYFALGGSIPQGVDKSVYNSLITLLKKKNIKVVLDSDGDNFKLGIEAKPYLIKPNLFELSQYLGINFNSTEDVVVACQRLYAEKGVNILCTLGEKGGLYAGEKGAYTVTSPKVALRGFTGAGDTFLATFLYAFNCSENRGDVEYALRFASSSAASKVELPGTELPSYKDMFKYIDIVKIYKI